MSWYNEVKESTEQIKPGTYNATLKKVTSKDSKKGDHMLVLGFAAGGSFVNRYVVIRKDLARMWIEDLAKIGIAVTNAIADAEAQQLTFDQFFWELLARGVERVGSTVEVAVSYTAGNDLPNVSIRKLVSEPRGDMETERQPGHDEDDAIPF